MMKTKLTSSCAMFAAVFCLLECASLASPSIPSNSTTDLIYVFSDISANGLTFRRIAASSSNANAGIILGNSFHL